MKNLFCTGRVPGSGRTDYQCMTSQFQVSRDAGGVILTCPNCRIVHRLETLEAGQRVNVVTNRGIGEESFAAQVLDGLLTVDVPGAPSTASTASDFAAAQGWESCDRVDCANYNRLAKRHCEHNIITPDSCATFTPEIMF